MEWPTRVFKAAKNAVHKCPCVGSNSLFILTDSNFCGIKRQVCQLLQGHFLDVGMGQRVAAPDRLPHAVLREARQEGGNQGWGTG